MPWLALGLYLLLSYNLTLWLYLTGKLLYLTGRPPQAAGPYEHGLARGLVFGAPLALPVYLGYVLLTAVLGPLFDPESRP